MVQPGDFHYMFPAQFEGKPNETAVLKVLHEAVLRNVIMDGAAAICHYDGVVIDSQRLYMSNMVNCEALWLSPLDSDVAAQGDMFGTILSWQVVEPVSWAAWLLTCCERRTAVV